MSVVYHGRYSRSKNGVASARLWSRPSTSFSRSRCKDVDARDERGMNATAVRFNQIGSRSRSVDRGGLSRGTDQADRARRLPSGRGGVLPVPSLAAHAAAGQQDRGLK
jgi:hypothetical protein